MSEVGVWRNTQDRCGARQRSLAVGLDSNAACRPMASKTGAAIRKTRGVIMNVRINTQAMVNLPGRGWPRPSRPLGTTCFRKQRPCQPLDGHRVSIVR